MVTTVIIYFLLSFYQDLRVDEENVRIEHIGESGKSISTLVICFICAKSRGDEVIRQVDTTTFKLVVGFVEANNTGLPDESNSDYGVFRISHFNHGRRMSYVVPSRKKSVEFLQGLRARLRESHSDNERLTRRIDGMLRQLNFYP